MRCPECSLPLREAAARGRPCHVCDACQGLWLAQQELEEAIGAPPPFREPAVALPSRRRCPACGEPMVAIAIDVVPVERCARHGVWFDRYELDMAVAAREPEAPGPVSRGPADRGPLGRFFASLRELFGGA